MSLLTVNTRYGLGNRLSLYANVVRHPAGTRSSALPISLLSLKDQFPNIQVDAGVVTLYSSGASTFGTWMQGVASDVTLNTLFLVSYTTNSIWSSSLGTGPVTMNAYAGSLPVGFSDDPVKFRYPLGIAVIPNDNGKAVADTENHRIRYEYRANSTRYWATIGTGVSGFANGLPWEARFRNPRDVAYNNTNGDLFVADTDNCLVRLIRYDFNDGTYRTTTIAGQLNTGGTTDGAGSAATIVPYSIAYDNVNNLIFVGDMYGRLRRIQFSNNQWNVTTMLAPDGGLIYFSTEITGIVVNSLGNALYITTSGVNNYGRYVYKVRYSPSSVITLEAVTIAGNGSEGFVQGTGTGAYFIRPSGIAIDSNDNLYVADSTYSSNASVRRIT